MFRIIIQSNYAGILASVFLLVFIVKDRSFQANITKLFLFSIISLLILIVADSINYYTSAYSTPDFWRRLSAALGYTLRPATVFFIIAICQRRNPKVVFYVSLPLIVNAIIALTSISTGWMFKYDAQNEFIRGPLGIFPFVVSGFYLLLLIILNIIAFRQDVMEATIIFLIVIMSGFAVILESGFKFKFILPSTISISILFYFLYLHVQIYKRDALTNLLNRRCFTIDLKKYQNKEMTLISLDLNNLKIINDTYGHSAGDVALTTIVACMQKAFRANCRIYRTGGDEFMVIVKSKVNGYASSVLSVFCKNMNKTQYSVAYGYAEYKPGMNISDVINQADARMYEKKDFMKSKK